MSAAHYPSASLYVGDLASDVTETVLFDKFNDVGAVASIRVCRDAVTHRSLGYAYVNFHSTADAQVALEQLNNTPLKGKPCRIMWSQRDPSLRKSGVGNIFIKNLHVSIDHKALYDTFIKFGNILSCKVATNEANESKGYGFVHFETQEMADRCIEQVNEMELEGQIVYVGRFIPKKERLKSREAQGFTNTYVKNLPENVDTDTLRNLFATYGTITSCVIMSDPNGKSKGFGFVNFANPDEAKKAVDELNGSNFNGNTLYVGRAQKKAERQAELKQRYQSETLNKYQGVNLYVKNLSDEIDDVRMRTEFAPFGNITSAEVMKDEKGNSKGFGFVCFSTPEEATKAVQEMNGRHVGSKPIYVALAQRKDVRKAQLMAQHAQRLKSANYNNGLNIYPTATSAAAPGAPSVFYQTPQTGNMPQPFMYHQILQQQQRNLGRWPMAHQPHYAPMQNYMIANLGRPARHNQRQPSNRGGGGGGRYNRNAREVSPGGAVGVGVGVGVGGAALPPMTPAVLIPVADQQVVGPQVPEALSSAELEQMTREQQSTIIGERLYPMIRQHLQHQHQVQHQPDLAGKITGMLLDGLTRGGLEELLVLLEDSRALSEKVSEAIEVLEAHMEGQSSDGKVIETIQ